MWTKWNGIYTLLHHYLIYKLVCSVSLNKMKPYTELYTENKWKCDNCVSAMANILMFWCIISNILVSLVCFNHAYLLLITDFNHVLYSRQNGFNLNLNNVDNHIWTSVSGNNSFKRWYFIDIYTTIHLKKNWDISSQPYENTRLASITSNYKRWMTIELLSISHARFDMSVNFWCKTHSL